MSAKDTGGSAFPVYEFRPIPGDFIGPFRRYANGEWIEDDGEYDVAFVSDGCGAPICLYVEHSYQRNIVSGWLTGHWRERDWRHPNGNPWHYALSADQSEWGGDWGSSSHENCRAGRKGMDYLCSKHRCANGRHVEIKNPAEPHIAAGLVRDRDTKEVLKAAEGVCMYCGDSNAKLIADAMLAARKEAQ